MLPGFKNPWHAKFPDNWIRIGAQNPEDHVKALTGLRPASSGLPRMLSDSEMEDAKKRGANYSQSFEMMHGVHAVVDPETGHVYHHTGVVSDENGVGIGRHSGPPAEFPAGPRKAIPEHTLTHLLSRGGKVIAEPGVVDAFAERKAAKGNVGDRANDSRRVVDPRV